VFHSTVESEFFIEEENKSTSTSTGLGGASHISYFNEGVERI
jgi:hypothetical protein